MICADVPGANDNFVAAIRSGQAYGCNSACITKDLIRDTLQKVFVCQKIITEMWPIRSGVGRLGSLPVFAWRRNNPAWQHQCRRGRMPRQEFYMRRRRHIVKPVQQPRMPGQTLHPDFDFWRWLKCEPAGCLIARPTRRGGDWHHRCGDMDLPASEDSGRTPDDRRATSGGTIQYRNPGRVAACARQRVRCHTSVEDIRYGLSAFPTSSPQTTSMHRTSFDKSPLKPRCVEPQFKARGTITQFGSRPCQGRVARQKAEALECRTFRNPQECWRAWTVQIDRLAGGPHHQKMLHRIVRQ